MSFTYWVKPFEKNYLHICAHNHSWPSVPLHKEFIRFSAVKLKTLIHWTLSRSNISSVSHLVYHVAQVGFLWRSYSIIWVGCRNEMHCCKIWVSMFYLPMHSRAAQLMLGNVKCPLWTESGFYIKHVSKVQLHLVNCFKSVYPWNTLLYAFARYWDKKEAVKIYCKINLPSGLGQHIFFKLSLEQKIHGTYKCLKVHIIFVTIF